MHRGFRSRVAAVLACLGLAALGCNKTEVEESYTPRLSEEQQQEVSEMDRQLQNLIQNQVQPTMNRGAGEQAPGVEPAPEGQ